MSREVITFLIDDIDGTKAAETVRFSLDGTAYEIDLTETNAGALRKGLAEFVAHARRVSAVSIRPGRVRNRENTEAIRQWAASAGLDVKPRGRVPAAIVDAYRAAMRAARTYPADVPRDHLEQSRLTGSEPAGAADAEPAPDGSQEPAEPPAGLAASDEPGEPQSPAQSPGPAPGTNEAIREWAARTGRDVKPRGRIPADVKADYTRAMENQS